MLDWFSDVGGLHGMFFTMIATVLAFFNYNRFENYLVSKLFKTERTMDEYKEYKK